MKTGRFAWALIRLVIFLPLWLVGLALLLVGLVLTPWGTKFALDQGARMGMLQYESVEGALLDSMDLQGFRLEVGSIRVSVDDLSLAWAEDCLLQGRVCLDHLRVAGADVRIGESEGKEEPVEEEPAGDGLTRMELPFPIEIREVGLDDVTIYLADGTRLEWKSFTTGAIAEGGTVAVEPTRLAGLRVILPLTPGAMLALSASEHEGPVISSDAIDAAIDVSSPLAAELQGLASRPLEERPRIELPEITLPLAVEVPELLVEDAALDGAAEYGVERLNLSLEARDQRVTIKPLAVSSVDADARLRADVTLSGDYPLNALLEADLYLPQRFPALDGERVELQLGGSLGELQVDLNLSGPVESQLTARVDALDPTFPFEATFTSPRLQWPMEGMQPTVADGSEETAEETTEGETSADEDHKPVSEQQPWIITDIDIKSSGSLVGHQIQLALNAEGPELPPTQVALEGGGDFKHFRWAPLSVSMDAGKLITEGEVSWEDGIDVNADLNLDSVNPAPFVEGLEGDLSGEAQVAFQLVENDWEVEVPVLDIHGSLDDRQLSLQGELSGNSDMQWNIKDFDFRQGDNRITLAGLISESRLDVNGQIDLPKMAELYPGLAGSLNGRIDAGGSLKAPQLDVALEGSGTGFQDNRVGRLNLVARVAGLEDPTLDIRLDADALEAGGQQFNSVALTLDGRLSNHQLALDVDGNDDGPLNSLTLAMDGAMNAARDRYRGTLTPLEIVVPQGRITLDQPLAFNANIAQSSVEADPFCLRREQGGAVCITEPLKASADSGRVVLTINELPMDLVNESLPDGWSIDGDTQADLTAGWSSGGSRWQAQADIDSDVSVTGVDAYGKAWTVPATTLALQADASEARIDVNLDVGLADNGDLGLDLAINDPMGNGALDGQLNISNVRLDPYRPLATGVDELEGALNGNITIAGTRAAPNLSGDINLSSLRVHGVDIPVAVTDGDLDIRLAGDRADISGYLNAEQGRLNIDGDATWPQGSWEANVALSAVQDPLLATMPAFGRIKLAPDLTIRATPSLLRVRGDVTIPWARLEVGKLPPSAVAPSGDEIIITREMDEAAREANAAAAEAEPGASTAQAMADAGMAIDIRVNLRLGPDMKLEAYGLETELEGNLEVRQVNGPLQLFGDVNLVDGRFRAYGQDLQIREGTIIFGGAPAQPLLDFEAIRNPANTADGVIAGLRVTGVASQPDLEIFSEPSMDETRALSYVLTGRAPEDGGGGSGGALTSALIGITLGKTGGAVGALGETFGIEDLSLDTSGSGDDSQVVVSGRLTDRLEVGYGVGVFSPIAELTLTYQLWRDLYLEAVSGSSQAVDLIYTFSFPGNPPDLD
ncbi:translocation/assembly module TamB domain-containing protein [Halomonas huangheensis]|uniref:Translocation and assembly module TamB C-terminal domain-containing protein n=1 Tax=Halomonas huangheensis TaxID=1178482 RepID=W1NCG9_9GAMM|nr:translocation/assembly module TamB domain-containing protein [Halomonas huangheensis]ALM52615.1 hypothetical protein AR456_10240 [Halomonas huangheensis]ERL52871.1 hypothetical protein BJB45_16460 [Halomonas huangheensis]